nr:integrase, catalytic region, zinc finger, CCHC-type, peptidase aspartic, catalytic [Tanacetum cinerariifolium]
MMSEKKVNTKPVDYAALNQISQDFETRFVPQTELSVEQVFWSQNSMNFEEPNISTRPTLFEVPKELPKVSMVNSSLKKLKFHLASFDVVVKERTTATSITEGTWGFEHTKACFRDEIIPFVKAVEQYCVESNRFQDKMKEVLTENERLLEQAISKDIVNIVVTANVNNAYEPVNECERRGIFQKNNSFSQQSVPSFDQLFEINELKAQSQEKDTTYKQLYDSIKSPRIRSKEQCDDLIKQFNIKSAGNSDLNASLQEKALVIIALKDTLRNLKRKVVVDEAVTLHPIDPKLLKIDVTPLARRLRNNRTAHYDYLEHTQKESATLREIVENKILLNPLNTSLDYNVNSDLQCATCNGCLFSDNYDSCVLEFINSVNARVKSKPTKKPLNRKIQKPTGKVFTNIRYKWKPTGRTFTIVGNTCPLTRITTTAKVTLRKPIPLESNTSKPVVTLVYSRKPKESKNNIPVSKSKNNKSLSADKKEPNKSWGSIISNVLSSSAVECMLSKLFSVKFGNDHVAKIIGYGDYKIGNVTILRVYFVEGLGHNLFSVGQFCDSDLEVAFRQHTCFIRSLEGVGLLTGSRGNNLYTLSLGYMMASSPICLLTKASKTKSWLWHRRLSHLNFGAINHLARQGLV